jgi:hypothetical protein
MSGDFIISVAIFLFVLAIVLPLFGQISERTRANSDQRELETRSVFVSDALIKTPGYPAAWDAASVETVGLSDGGKLNATKIRSLLSMTYSSARDAMSVGDLNFNLSFRDINGYALFNGLVQSPAAYFYADHNTVQQFLDGQPVVWDIYYGGTGTPDIGNSRNYYSGTPQAVFNEMVGNQSAYKTIIIEEAQLTQAEVDIQSLKDFVASGGVLLLIGDAGLISSGFSMSSGTAPGSGGTVVNTDDLLVAAINDDVVFNNSRWYFYRDAGDEDLDIFVASSTDPSRALMGRWGHGAGVIYFFTDIAGTVGTSQLTQSLDLVGRKLEHGTELSETATISAVQRSAILGGYRDRFARVTLLLWK